MKKNTSWVGAVQKSLRACGAVLLAFLGSASCGDTGSTQSPVAVVRSPLTSVSVEVPIPPAIAANQLVLAANGSLLIDDRARVPLTGSAGLSNEGSGQTAIGVGAIVGDTWSVPSVFLRDNARVNGALRTASVVQRQNGTVVVGKVVEHAVLQPSDFLRWTVNLPDTNAGDLTVGPDQSKTLPPGSYGNVNIRSRSSLKLSAGTYHFLSFNLEPQVTLQRDTSHGPIVVYVRNSAQFHSAVGDAASASNFLLVYLGTNLVDLSVPFNGSLVAPNASLIFESGAHVGAFFAHDIEARPDVSVTFTPFVSLPVGACTGAADGTACDDGSKCTQSDVCSSGVCKGAATVCAAPANGCLQAFCAPSTGQCLTAPADGKACDDGNPTTQNDICIAGTCAPPVAGARCATDADYALRLHDPTYAQRRRDIGQGTADFEAKVGADPESSTRSGVYVIPVVVHVVWNTNAQNITDAQVQHGIDLLNTDYRLLNADAASVPAEFASLTADTRVEFRLAQRDPGCAATTGIEHVKTTTTAFEGRCNVDSVHCDDVKKTAAGGADAWPSDRYLNVWVSPLAGDLLGRGTFPGGAAAVDGVIINVTAWGDSAPAQAPFNRNRTATHEIGHWLDLFHTFQDGCTGVTADTCLTGGDLVCDTPGTATNNFGCPGTQNTCTDSPVDSHDQTMNYMDYVDDACMLMFSAGQSVRIAATLNGARAGILGSSGAYPPPAVTADVWSQDTPEDTGAEPNTASTVFSVSDDIWVRNAGDGTTDQEHQNPIFRAAGPPNHVYVRVRNLGCGTSENANARLYWAKASVNLAWPQPWDGTVTTPALMGSPIATQPTGALAPGAFTILDFPWSPPNPADYASFGADQSHFCLLTRLETSATAPFGMTSAETSDLVGNVSKNNNIVWKNVEVTGDGSGRQASASASGPSDGSSMRLDFSEPAFPRHAGSVFAWGDVFVDLGPVIYNRWVQGGQQGSGIALAGGTSISVSHSGASLSHVLLGASELGTFRVSFVPHAASSEPNRGRPDIYLLDVTASAERPSGLQKIGGQRFTLKTVRPLIEEEGPPVVR